LSVSVFYYAIEKTDASSEINLGTCFFYRSLNFRISGLLNPVILGSVGLSSLIFFMLSYMALGSFLNLRILTAKLRFFLFWTQGSSDSSNYQIFGYYMKFTYIIIQFLHRKSTKV